MTMHDQFLRDSDTRKLPESKPWRGFILDAPATEADDLFVVIPGISGELRRGPCLWMPRAGVSGQVLPAGGEACIARMDTDKQWWILAWSPHAE